MADLATTANWMPRSAWAGILPDGRFGLEGATGVRVAAREGLGIASLIAPADKANALAQAVKARFALDLPQSPAITRADTHAAVWTGPGQWLLMADEGAGFTETLAALSAFVAVADQGSARAVLRISGPRVRETLAKGCMIDLHPTAFPVGMTALTSIAHIGVHLWRLPDDPDGAVFEIMVARSMAGSFWSWFAASVAAFGCEVVAGAAAARG